MWIYLWISSAFWIQCCEGFAKCLKKQTSHAYINLVFWSSVLWVWSQLFLGDGNTKPSVRRPMDVFATHESHCSWLLTLELHHPEYMGINFSSCLQSYLLLTLTSKQFLQEMKINWTSYQTNSVYQFQSKFHLFMTKLNFRYILFALNKAMLMH